MRTLYQVPAKLGGRPMYYPVVKARVEPAMKPATPALGGLRASISIPTKFGSAGSRRHEARPNAGQGSPQAPRSGAVWWIGAPSALWRLMLPARAKQEIEPR